MSDNIYGEGEAAQCSLAFVITEAAYQTASVRLFVRVVGGYRRLSC